MSTSVGKAADWKLRKLEQILIRHDHNRLRQRSSDTLGR
jgi:hypothetical protein